MRAAKRSLGRNPLAAIFFGLRRAFWFGLGVTNGLGQHLAKLSFCLRRFARDGFCPSGHERYMGMPPSVLNP